MPRYTTVWMDFLKKKNISLDVKDVLVHLVAVVTRSRGGPATGRWVTRTGEQAGKALRSQGHQYARVM